jgi:hypothetical protein
MVDVFVIMALALVLLCAGGAVVAAVLLRRTVREMMAGIRGAKAQAAPLTGELRAEGAVTALEIAALRETLAARSGRA